MLEYFPAFIQKVCDYTVGDNYEIDFPNVLFNNGTTGQHFYHRDYPDVNLDKKT